MKKTYQKPMVVVEKFELSQHIAACMNKVTDLNATIKEGCSGTGHIDGSIMPNIFLDKGSSKCNVDMGDICYASASTGDTFLFQS